MSKIKTKFPTEVEMIEARFKKLTEINELLKSCGGEHASEKELKRQAQQETLSKRNRVAKELNKWKSEERTSAQIIDYRRKRLADGKKLTRSKEAIVKKQARLKKYEVALVKENSAYKKGELETKIKKLEIDLEHLHSVIAAIEAKKRKS